MKNDKLERRAFIKQGVSVVAGVAGLVMAPYVLAKKTPTVRVLGTHVTLQEEIRQRAMQDLGINLVFEARGSGAAKSVDQT